MAGDARRDGQWVREEGGGGTTLNVRAIDLTEVKFLIDLTPLSSSTCLRTSSSVNIQCLIDREKKSSEKSETAGFFFFFGFLYQPQNSRTEH